MLQKYFTTGAKKIFYCWYYKNISLLVLQKYFTGTDLGYDNPENDVVAEGEDTPNHSQWSVFSEQSEWLCWYVDTVMPILVHVDTIVTLISLCVTCYVSGDQTTTEETVSGQPGWVFTDGHLVTGHLLLLWSQSTMKLSQDLPNNFVFQLAEYWTCLNGFTLVII